MPQEFFINGVPKPAGSKRAFKHRITERIIVTDTCKTGKQWRQIVQRQVREQGAVMYEGPIGVSATFFIQRPKSHLKADGTLRKGYIDHHVIKPDATKLWRAAEDALTGILWADDSQVVSQTVQKMYAAEPGLQLMVWEFTK